MWRWRGGQEREEPTKSQSLPGSWPEGGRGTYDKCFFGGEGVGVGVGVEKI